MGLCFVVIFLEVLCGVFVYILLFFVVIWFYLVGKYSFLVGLKVSFKFIGFFLWKGEGENGIGEVLSGVVVFLGVVVRIVFFRVVFFF